MVAAASDSFSLAAVPFAAASGSYVLLKLMSRSQPLQEATLKWLTNRDPAATIHRQYILVRRFLYGRNYKSWKRNLSFFMVFLAFFLFLFGFEKASFEIGPNTGLPVAIVRMYAIWYFHFWAVAPLECLLLLLVGYLICHASFYIFDVITLRWWRFGNNFWKYLLLLAIGYAICIVLLLPILGLLADSIISQRNDESIFQAIGRAILEIPERFRSLFIEEGDNDMGDVVVFGIKVGIFGTMALCMSAVLIITAINLVYAGSLGLLKIEYLLRVKYGYSQESILEDPISYVAAMISIAIFIIVLLGMLVLRLASTLSA